MIDGKILSGHNTENTAYIVNDYPYGFRLRTKIKYWIESTKNGDRFYSQTLNPKTNLWNKPKKGTYTAIEILYIDNASGYIKTFCINEAYSTEEEYKTFLTDTEGYNFNELQKNKLKRIKALIETRKYIHVTIAHEVYKTPEEKEAHDRQQEEEKQKILRLFNYNLSKA